MRKLVFSLLLILLMTYPLFAQNEETSYVESKTPTWHIIVYGGAQSFVDDWMRTTYGISPYVGFEFSKRVSPIIDGVSEMGFCMDNGTYVYGWPWNGPYDIAHHYKLKYAELSLGLRACDRRLGEGSPFVEVGFDAAHIRENNEDYSEKGSAMGTHIAAGYWCYIAKGWVVQAKGKLQLLSVSIQPEEAYTRSYEIDLSGMQLTIGIGFGR